MALTVCLVAGEQVERAGLLLGGGGEPRAARPARRRSAPRPGRSRGSAPGSGDRAPSRSPRRPGRPIGRRSGRAAGWSARPRAGRRRAGSRASWSRWRTSSVSCWRETFSSRAASSSVAWPGELAVGRPARRGPRDRILHRDPDEPWRPFESRSGPRCSPGRARGPCGRTARPARGTPGRQRLAAQVDSTATATAARAARPVPLGHARDEAAHQTGSRDVPP